MEEGKPSSEGLAIFSYLLAAVILLPIGWWLKTSYHAPLAAWFNSFIH